MARRLGPDAHRYLAMGAGQTPTRPFHLRWLLPAVCGTSLRRWWVVYLASWPVLAAGLGWWALEAGHTPARALVAVVLLLGLPGILGPAVSIPVQTDLPATALTALGVAAITHGGVPWTAAGVALIIIAATMRETAPIWGALWAWSAWPLLALGAVTLAVWRRPAAETSGVPEWDEIARRPFAAGRRYHAGRWRDAQLMVLPWGACLAGLYAIPARLGLILAAAYAQLAIATDTVRLYQHAAGPPMALAAAGVVPLEWAPVVLVFHLAWVVPMERI